MKQSQALAFLIHGNNTFITGSAGTGKTYLTEQYIKHLEANHTPFAVVAPTGISALNIGGVTIHSYFRFFGKYSEYAQRANYNKAKIAELNTLEVLIIEEVSMVTPELFTQMDDVLRWAKQEPNKPFGGVQVVIVGDFFQLEPVVKNRADKFILNRRQLNNITDEVKEKMGKSASDGFWENEYHKIREVLKTVKYGRYAYPLIRQTTINIVSGADKRVFAWQSVLWAECELNTIYLQEKMRQTKGDKLIPILDDIRSGKVSKETRKSLAEMRNNQINEDLAMKLFPINTDVNQINSRGLSLLNTKEYTSKADIWTMYDDEDKRTENKFFKNSLWIKDLKYKVGAKVMFIINKNGMFVNGTQGIIREIEGDTIVVETIGEDGSEELLYVMKEEFEYKNEKGKTILTCTQFPFMLAWATTIHKAQGLTLQYVELDLSSCFSHGQGYVGLSRCKSFEGIKLTGLNEIALMVNPLNLRIDNRMKQASERTLKKHEKQQAHSLELTMKPIPKGN